MNNGFNGSSCMLRTQASAAIVVVLLAMAPCGTLAQRGGGDRSDRGASGRDSARSTEGRRDTTGTAPAPKETTRPAETRRDATDRAPAVRETTRPAETRRDATDRAPSVRETTRPAETRRDATDRAPAPRDTSRATEPRVERDWRQSVPRQPSAMRDTARSPETRGAADRATADRSTGVRTEPHREQTDSVRSEVRDRAVAEPSTRRGGGSWWSSAEPGQRDGSRGNDQGDRGTAGRDRAGADRAPGDRGSSDRATGDRGSSDRATGDRGSSDRATGDRGSSDRATGDRGAAGRDRAGTDRAPGDRGASDRAPGDRGTAGRDRATGGQGDRVGTGRDRAPSRDTQADRDARRRGGPDTAGRDTRDRYAGARSTDGREHRSNWLTSLEGRRFRNGISARPAIPVAHVMPRRYFHDGHAFYPHYAPTFSLSIVFYSPYSCYYDLCAPWIYRTHCHYLPPAVVYIDQPLVIVRDDGDDYYYLSGSSWRRERGLQTAVEDIEDAFAKGDLDLLADHVSLGGRIAVYNRGRYDYSIDGSDYLDMTRDALRAIDTVRLDLYRIRKRGDGVYVASGVHEFKDGEGVTRRVLVSFGLERRDGVWTITQVSTAPPA